MSEEGKERVSILQQFTLKGKTAVVTGGAGLLGAEFCRTLAEAGAKIAVADLDAVKAKKIAKNLCELGFRAVAIKTDVTSRESVHEMVCKIVKEYGQLDILVNSAAMDPKFDHNSRLDLHELSTSFEDYPLEIWEQALNVNLTGAFLCCQAAVKPMLSQGSGVIVNVSSIYGLTGPDQRIYRQSDGQMEFKPVYYSVSKAGILGLTRYLATYYAGSNIRVNALTPGGVFNKHDDDFVRAYSSRAVLGRMAEKDEMNGALLFLVSNASSYMTGANLIVDGGWTAW